VVANRDGGGDGGNGDGGSEGRDGRKNEGWQDVYIRTRHVVFKGCGGTTMIVAEDR
jgi:hypothetical protein